MDYKKVVNMSFFLLSRPNIFSLLMVHFVTEFSFFFCLVIVAFFTIWNLE